MSNEDLQEMVGNFLKLLNLSDVCPHNRLLFLIHADSSEHLCVHELAVIKVSQGRRQLTLLLLIENDLRCASIIVDLKDDSHLLLAAGDHSSDNDDLNFNIKRERPYLADLLAIDLKVVLLVHGSLGEHLECHRSENLLLSLLSTPLVSPAEPSVSPCTEIVVVVPPTRSEEAWVVIGELNKLGRANLNTMLDQKLR